MYEIEEQKIKLVSDNELIYKNKESLKIEIAQLNIKKNGTRRK